MTRRVTHRRYITSLPPVSRSDRLRAVTYLGPVRVTGLAGWLAWLAWLVVTLTLLTGFTNRFATLAGWTIAFFVGAPATDAWRTTDPSPEHARSSSQKQRTPANDAPDAS